MALYNHNLAKQLLRATSVRATEVGAFNPRHRDGTRELLRVSEADDLKALVATLAIDDSSLDEQIALMTPGEIQLNFLDGHSLVASIALILPGYLRWDGLPYDARLLDKHAVGAWLAARGWQPPVGPRSESASPSDEHHAGPARLRFRVEYLHKKGPPTVFVRRLTPGEFALTPTATLGGIPIEPFVSAPRARKTDGSPDMDLLAFVLSSRADLVRLSVGAEVVLIP